MVAAPNVGWVALSVVLLLLSVAAGFLLCLVFAL